MDNIVDAEKLLAMRRQVQDRVAVEQPDLDSGEAVTGQADHSFVINCLHANELGDGALFCQVNFRKFLYNASGGEWYTWTGHHWTRDIKREALTAVQRVCGKYVEVLEQTTEQLATAKDEGRRGSLEYRKKQLQRRIDKLRSVRGRSNCLEFAATLENGPMTVTGDMLDGHPWLFACANGVIDLRNGKHRPGRPEDYLVKASPVEWQGLDAPATTWEKTVLEIFSGDVEMAFYFQRLLGYAITGCCTEAIFPVLNGRGRNGKSLLVETFSYVLGELAGAIPSEMLLDQGGHSRNPAGPSPDIMALRGLRVAFASETDDGRRISPSRVKWLTGGDTLVGRSPHDKYASEFQATHTLFLLTNHKPKAPADDFAFWERMQLVPFEVSFVNRNPQAAEERRADRGLLEKLKSEAPGILAWLVRGCLMWQRGGLQPPEKVTKATEEYRRDEDLIGDFIEERCRIDTEATIKATALYNAYSDWHEKNVGKKIPNQKSFGKLMSRKFEKEKRGVFYYLGLQLETVYD